MSEITYYDYLPPINPVSPQGEAGQTKMKLHEATAKGQKLRVFLTPDHMQKNGQPKVREWVYLAHQVIFRAEGEDAKILKNLVQDPNILAGPAKSLTQAIRQIIEEVRNGKRSAPTYERVHFRLIVCPDCTTQICWVNPRLPTHCPECGNMIFDRVKSCVMISDDNAALKYDPDKTL